MQAVRVQLVHILIVPAVQYACLYVCHICCAHMVEQKMFMGKMFAKVFAEKLLCV